MTLSESHIRLTAQELKLQPKQVYATAMLLQEGGTVPFIARYRKEVTGTLDEVAITNIRDRLSQLAELDARRDSILKSLSERNLLTDSLQQSLTTAQTLTRLEDLYQPFRPKRRTRATMAKEAGLEPLADLLWSQNSTLDPNQEALKFTKNHLPDSPIETAEDALAGARDILAERISDDSSAREQLRQYYREHSLLSSKLIKGKETEAAKFKDYFAWSEPLTSAPSHRILALRRGEKEGFLMVRIQPPAEPAVQLLQQLFVRGSSPSSLQVSTAAADAYDRLLGPAIEVEMRLESKKRADEQAIQVFVENIRELLLASPLGQKNVLAIDPGFRTGCKIVLLNPQGKLLTHCVIYPDKSDFERREAAEVIRKLSAHFKVEAIAIGNGTAGRETETFIRSLKLPPSILIVMVNESGASIYSASDVAREEFPDQDLTVRGSISIGRRLMDPLAELVKIDPKSIGVGQYQHDVDQNALKRSLDDTVMSCVNGVGVELNTASKQLLTYVSGLGPSLAEAIVSFRNQHGPFQTRKELLKVPRLGDKAFEQAAGFLRIRDGLNPLDASAVHPESYPLVEAMARDLHCQPADLMRDSALRGKIKLESYVNEKVGLPTLRDILNELAKPGRDPRAQFEVFSFAQGVSEVSHLQPGMKLPGIVTNVTAFGAFVDIGVHQDGLVHISQLSDTFVKNPADVVKVQDKVTVTVMEVDTERKRVALSMKSRPELSAISKGGGMKNARSNSGLNPGSAPTRPSPSSPQGLGGGLFAEALARREK
ncbi:MAG: RNA-binding transcriptional accessory protein [Blastochloris sp.]|nr:RNA-binding transcriptional accessory protein [Blastochloris sp.]